MSLKVILKFLTFLWTTFVLVFIFFPRITKTIYKFREFVITPKIQKKKFVQSDGLLLMRKKSCVLEVLFTSIFGAALGPNKILQSMIYFEGKSI